MELLLLERLTSFEFQELRQDNGFFELSMYRK